MRNTIALYWKPTVLNILTMLMLVAALLTFYWGRQGAPNPPIDVAVPAQVGELDIAYSTEVTPVGTAISYLPTTSGKDNLRVAFTIAPNTDLPRSTIVLVVRFERGAEVSEAPEVESTPPVVSDYTVVGPDVHQLVIRSREDGAIPTSISLEARTARQIRTTSNARTVVIAPRVPSPVSCESRLIQGDVISGNKIVSGCVIPKSSVATLRALSPDYRTRVDNTNRETVSPGELMWNLRDSDGFVPVYYGASFVNIDEESEGNALTFLSAGLVGLVSALFPLSVSSVLKAVRLREGSAQRQSQSMPRRVNGRFNQR